jgi:hypothetical protein
VKPGTSSAQYMTLNMKPGTSSAQYMTLDVKSSFTYMWLLW